MATSPPARRPEAVDPGRAAGRLGLGSVREILVNPNYTGYVVWNRRATKDKRHPGKNNRARNG